MVFEIKQSQRRAKMLVQFQQRRQRGRGIQSVRQIQSTSVRQKRLGLGQFDLREMRVVPPTLEKGAIKGGKKPALGASRVAQRIAVLGEFAKCVLRQVGGV